MSPGALHRDHGVTTTTIRQEREVEWITNTEDRYSELQIYVFVLYGCQTWYLTSTAEHSLRVFKSGVLRKTCGSERDEVTGD